MTNFIKELEDELKQERLLGFFKSYGKLILAVIIFLIVVTSVLAWKENSRIKQEVAASEEFRKANELEAVDAQKAFAAYEKIEQNAPDGFAQLAILKKAAYLAKNNKPEEAIAVYDEFAKSSFGDVAIREFAYLTATYLMIEHKIGDDSEIDERLAELTKDQHPWRLSALELKAVKLLKDGKSNEALTIFKDLSGNRLAPQDLRTRANKMMKIIAN